MPMRTHHAWILQALADVASIGRCHFLLAHMLHPMLAENERWCQVNVHTLCLMHKYLGRCLLTLVGVVFHIHRWYARCVKAMTNVFCHWPMCIGHDWCLLVDVHARCSIFACLGRCILLLVDVIIHMKMSDARRHDWWRLTLSMRVCYDRYRQDD